MPSNWLEFLASTLWRWDSQELKAVWTNGLNGRASSTWFLASSSLAVIPTCAKQEQIHVPSARPMITLPCPATTARYKAGENLKQGAFSSQSHDVCSQYGKEAESKYRVFRRWASLTQNQRLTSQSAGKGPYLIPSDGDDKPLLKDLGDHNRVKSFASLADQGPPCHKPSLSSWSAEYIGKKTYISAKKCFTFKLFFLTSIHRCLTEEAGWMLLKGSRDYKPTETHFINHSSFLNPVLCP